MQLYIKYDDIVNQDPKFIPIEFPLKVLRGFEKVALEKGETKTVHFGLTRRDLSYWDVVSQNWIMPSKGTFIVRIGASSRDLRLSRWY